MKNENGLTLQDLHNLAVEQGLEPDSIYLVMPDGQPIVEIDYSEDCPDLWFLGDEE